ncbi:MAG: group II intron reverse transcriptase/maturase [Lachnospiraceae bacterium]|nr:group II intron reverse transcriptase/maturase [Lachnospiraceae bacterium]
MRNPINVLKSLEDKACVSNYRYERLYRNLYNPEFYLLAYANVAKSQGSMTAGADGQTLEGMSMPRIERIIQSMKDKSYQPQPARRKYIPKKNGKLRPLGVPSTDDKIVQEIVRMILEAIYEPTFENCSHGFRPHRSCHTALTQVKREFTGAKWIVEGDIHACFDNFDHHVLIDLLRKRINDEAFIELIWKFLKAGYMEQWEYHCTYSGTPQGSGISPVCANIYLTELDRFILEYKKKFDRETVTRRKTSKEYEKASRRYRKARRAMAENAVHTPEMVREFKESRREKIAQNYNDPFDESFKKVQYNRYADDFVIGVIGSKEDAKKIKEDVKDFLSQKLHLEMSEEKTKITHSSEKVRYLGYDFKVIRSKNVKRTKTGDLKNPWYGKVFLYVPKEKWMAKAMEREAVEVKRDEVTRREAWRPMPRKELMNLNDAEIVTRFNSEIRGLYNYYMIAENVGVLHKYYYMARYSMLKTLAGKHRTHVSEIKKRYMKSGILRIPYTTNTGPKVCEFYHDGFRKQQRGYENISDILPTYKKYDTRFTIINRLKAGKCEICGCDADYLIMHHVRTLKQLTGKDIYEQKMLEIRRKSLALCPNCYSEYSHAWEHPFSRLRAYHSQCILMLESIHYI